VVGVEISGGYDSSDAALLAVRRGTVNKFDGWAAMAGEFDGGIPATRFTLPISGVALLQKFKRFAIHATRAEALHNQGIELLIENDVYPPEPG
jgi:hypothetical protein